MTCRRSIRSHIEPFQLAASSNHSERWEPDTFDYPSD